MRKVELMVDGGATGAPFGAPILRVNHTLYVPAPTCGWPVFHLQVLEKNRQLDL
jgi:hypothetical protein